MAGTSQGSLQGWHHRRRAREDAPTKPRKYQAIWELIAANASDKPVKVRCPKENQARLIAAVKLEKKNANALRRGVDAVGYGKLIIKQEGDFVLFGITYSGDMI